jgi:hypothetical protein
LPLTSAGIFESIYLIFFLVSFEELVFWVSFRDFTGLVEIVDDLREERTPFSRTLIG